MICIEDLQESDKGRIVTYQRCGGTEYGRITSWNEKFIFVHYHGYQDDDWLQCTLIEGDTSKATRPEDLEFCL